MRKRAHRGRGPSRWERATEAVAKAIAGLAVLIAMIGVLRVTDASSNGSDGWVMACASSAVAALAWTIGRRAEHRASQIEAIARRAQAGSNPPEK